jgi:hypothetical protein
MNKITLALALAFLAAPASAQFQTCQWPNKCGKKAVTIRLSQVQPCVWPKTCAAAPVKKVALAPITTCQWPNTCKA